MYRTRQALSHHRPRDRATTATTWPTWIGVSGGQASAPPRRNWSHRPRAAPDARKTGSPRPGAELLRLLLQQGGEGALGQPLGGGFGEWLHGGQVDID
jgi:hypothetical protein